MFYPWNSHPLLHTDLYRKFGGSRAPSYFRQHQRQTRQEGKYYQNPEQTASGAFEVVQETARAVWWSPPSLLPEQGCTREMAGEIHLAKDLQPSCSFFPFNVLVITSFLA
jgi:hypothetical protein